MSIPNFIFKEYSDELEMWVVGYHVHCKPSRRTRGQVVSEFDSSADFIVTIHGDKIEVRPDTVEIAIPGFTDVAGLRIYTGDTVHIESIATGKSGLFKVVYRPEELCFEFDAEDGSRTFTFDELLKYKLDDEVAAEIVGVKNKLKNFVKLTKTT